MSLKKMKQALSFGLAAMLAVTAAFSSTQTALAATAQKASAPSINPLPANAPREQDDFYTAVNYDWLKKTKIPKNQPSVGGFEDIMNKNSEVLQNDFDNMLKKGKDKENSPLGQAVAFYKMTMDFEKLDKDGADPIKPLINQIKALKNYEEYDKNRIKLEQLGLSTVVDIGVNADMKDATKYSLYMAGPSLFLSDKSYYDADNKIGTLLIAEYQKMLEKFLKLTGESELDAKRIAKQAIEFDKLLLPTELTAAESSSYLTIYNPSKTAVVDGKMKNINLQDYILKTAGQSVDTVVVVNPRFVELHDKIFNQENFENMKSWLLCNTISSMSSLLSDDFRQAKADLSRVFAGVEPSEREEVAFSIAESLFSEVVGDYYAKTYFGEAAKKDVEDMTKQIIAMYKNRIGEKDWLSDATKKEAAKKLDTMTVLIGFPEKIKPVYNELKVTPSSQGGTLYSNYISMSEVRAKAYFAKLKQKVDRSQWAIPAQTVNAMYNPMSNSICFPAGILQGVFYDIDRSRSENLGAIGVVIGHEISHAFDNNGSKYDEKGNLRNWWTRKDFVKFESKTNAMKEMFNKLTFAGQKMNGQMLLGENVADNGGLRVAIEVAKLGKDYNADHFFRSYATMWRMKATEQYTQLLIVLDVHAPNQLRVNVQLSNMDEFYETYDVKKGDKMYIDPDKRITIW